MSDPVWMLIYGISVATMALVWWSDRRKAAAFAEQQSQLITSISASRCSLLRQKAKVSDNLEVCQNTLAESRHSVDGLNEVLTTIHGAVSSPRPTGRPPRSGRSNARRQLDRFASRSRSSTPA